MHIESVRYVLRQANRGALESVLYPRQEQRGPKPRLEAAQIAALLGLMHHSPADYGLATQRWTLTDLAEIAIRQGVIPAISPSRLWRVLTAHGRSWKQAKRRMTSPDPEYEEKKGAVSSLSR
jgi:transposase